MRYSVEIENGIAKETLVFGGKEYSRTTEQTCYGTSSEGMDFSEQLKDKGIDNYVLDQICDTLDCFLVSNLLDIAESEGKNECNNLQNQTI